MDETTEALSKGQYRAFPAGAICRPAAVEHRLERLLTLHEVRRLVPLSKTAIYGMIKRQEFPVPIKIGTKRVAWAASDIARWQCQRPTAIELVAA